MNYKNNEKVQVKLLAAFTWVKQRCLWNGGKNRGIRISQ